MSKLIKKELEFYEVLNSFPFLEERLEKYNIKDIKEGISIEEYLKNNKSYNDDEIFILINKINEDIKYYLKHEKFPEERKIKIIKKTNI